MQCGCRCGVCFPSKPRIALEVSIDDYIFQSVVGPGESYGHCYAISSSVGVVLGHGFSSIHFFYCVLNHNNTGRRSAILLSALHDTYMLEVLEGVLCVLESLEGMLHMPDAVENRALYAVGTVGDALCVDVLEVVLHVLEGLKACAVCRFWIWKPQKLCWRC